MTILNCSEIDQQQLRSLLNRYGMEIQSVDNDAEIPGSFWQPPEAGLIGNILYIRNDTPVHSALHEACHFICMDETRRQGLDTDAGGGYEEEDAVCFLQILLSEQIPGMGTERMLDDMDKWGYSFRLGSAKAWFEKDAEDAQQWLSKHSIIDTDINPTFHIRK